MSRDNLPFQFINVILDFRSITPKDLKVFLCDHMNYKLETDELSKIMKVCPLPRFYWTVLCYLSFPVY